MERIKKRSRNEETSVSMVCETCSSFDSTRAESFVACCGLSFPLKDLIGQCTTEGVCGKKALSDV